jgi:hypothetical protein
MKPKQEVLLGFESLIDDVPPTITLGEIETLARRLMADEPETARPREPEPSSVVITAFITPAAIECGGGNDYRPL